MPSSSSSSPEIRASEQVRNSSNHFSYKDATQEEVLEDLSSRFILNLPDEELNSLERLCFQVEQAHWFYEDFIREENTKLPSMALKRFSEMLFHACPLLQQWSHDHEEAFKNFMQYKTRVPVCGAIMLNDAMDKCVLVKGWKPSSNWGFPKGKINETEPPASCAVREVLEETGYNLAGQIDQENAIELTIKEQKISLFIVPGVPENFNFQTKTRKEISQIAWFKLSDLPTWKKSKPQQPNRKFYLISPFIGPLKNFISERRRREKGGSRQRKGNQGFSSSPNVRPNDVLEPQFQSSVNAHPVAVENELGPELSRLFSGLNKGGVQSSLEASQVSKTTESNSDYPSDVSIDSPVRTGVQLQPNSAPAPSEQKSHPPRIARNMAVSPSRPHSLARPQTSQLTPHRKGSSTADISPYLSSKTDLSVSAKTLQHLQLLETVADESARLAPILAAQAASVRQGAPSTIQALTPNTNELIYSSNDPSHAGYPNRIVATNLTQESSSQLRSKTSQSFNRPTIHNPTGSLSLHQNHLLAVMNGARSVPVTPLYHTSQSLNTRLPAIQHAYFSPAPPLHSYPGSIPTAPPPFIPVAGSGAPHPLRHSMPLPMGNPTLTSFVPNPPLHADSNTGVNITPPAPNLLLSILNGRPN